MRKLFSILTGVALSMVLLTSCEKNPETGSGIISDAGAVSGVLKDAETGKTMANKTICLYGYPYLFLTTKTDAEGRFFFGHLMPNVSYHLYDAWEGSEYYELVYLAVDGEIRDLSGDPEEDFYHFDDKGWIFSVKAGQIRNLEVRVKKDIYEED